MTQAEIDKKMFELNNFIADKFKDMQMLTQTLRNPEDVLKSNQTMTKITDSIADVRRAYSDISALDAIIPEEENEENNTYGFPFTRHMK